jgi:hypothetical protein
MFSQDLPRVEDERRAAFIPVIGAHAWNAARGPE